VPERPVTLGIDLGSSATKAVLVDPAGGVVASASRPVDLHSWQPGWAEADPRVWWQNVTALVPELLALADVPRQDVAAVACAGMVPAVLCLDRHDQPVRPAILQNDARAVAAIAELAVELTSVDLLERTGSVLSQQSVAPTLRWLQRHEPQAWQDTALIVGSYDWLAIALGAHPHVEQNWALESGLFDFEGSPVREVWDAVELDGAKVPPLARSGVQVGEVSRAAGVALGLDAGTPIVVGGADHVLSAFGAGLSEAGDWLIKLGGAGDVLAVSNDRLLDERLYLDAHPAPGRWLPNGCMATSGSLLRWLQHVAGDVDLLTLDAEAEQRRPASLVCLPYFLGEKSPLHDPDLRGAFIGLHLGTTRGDLHRASLEAIAYGFRQHAEIFTERGLPLHTPRVTNGGSRSVLWKQILADVLQRPLVPVLDHPGASFGAAIAAAIGVGAVDDWTAVGPLVRTGSPVEPDPAAAAAYAEGYRMFNELEPAIRSFSHALAAGGGRW
jgi:xylulokinase